MATRIFEVTDTDRSGEVDQAELFAILSRLATGDNSHKLKFLFDVCDTNGQLLHLSFHWCRSGKQQHIFCYRLQGSQKGDRCPSSE